jgi:hypothetical protein
MRAARPALLAWPLCGLAFAIGLGIVVLDLLDRNRIRSFGDLQTNGIVMSISFALLGAMIVSRQSGNRIGWIYLGIGIVIPIQGLSAAYYERSVLFGGLAGADWAAWATNWTSTLVFPTGLALFAFMLFPSGRLPSGRWRAVGWAAIAIAATGVLLEWLDPSPINVTDGLPLATNPTGVRAIGTNLNGGLGGTSLFVFGMALIALVIGHLAWRGRRAPLQERQQVKLLAYAAFSTIATLIVVMVMALSGLSVSNTAWDIPIALGFGIAVPLACTFAILKHGLYEIDRLISRTVSYAILTGLLVGIFLGLVLLATRVLPFSSPVAVAASTLAAAALFNPLRNRVQRTVDRRFNRARYDSEATVAGFSVRLREAVDLDTVRIDLLSAVDDAVEPLHVALWIRQPTSR